MIWSRFLFSEPFAVPCTWKNHRRRTPICKDMSYITNIRPPVYPQLKSPVVNCVPFCL